MTVRWRDGVDANDAVEGIGLPMARTIAPIAPPEMNGLSDVRGVPLLAAAALVVLGVIATAHALVVTVRRRRRELGVLGAIGFAPGDRSAAISAQATTIALVALAVGVPLGVTVGRVVWSTRADGLGVAGDAAFPFALLAVGALGMVIVLNVIAVWPALRARRMLIATALRSE
jgi:ABC-type antimicrobial peptide transport system permease subunit